MRTPANSTIPNKSHDEVRDSVKVLEECINLQISKSQDYQADVSEVNQADYYLSGIDTIYEIMHAKMLRIRSVQDKARAGYGTNHESLEDSYKDLINYASFAVSYLRGTMDGQALNRDMFNRPLNFGTYSATSNITNSTTEI